MKAIRPVGELLRDWRQRRGLTQMHLAHLAETSPRHVSFIETGRSLPSRALLLRLAERLDVPLRERNVLMTAAGLAPMYAERRIKDDPALVQARTAVELVLRCHEPYPAIAIDRHWNLLARNRALGPLHGGVAPFLSEPPLNVLRLSLHPEGLAPRIANLGEWRAHLLHRLRHQADATGDPVLHELHEELSGYPGPAAPDTPLSGTQSFAVPMRLRTPLGVLSFISTTTVFGTPMDVTLAEIAIESFLPADNTTATLLQTAMASQEWPDGRWEPEPAR